MTYIPSKNQKKKKISLQENTFTTISKKRNINRKRVDKIISHAQIKIP